jgi:hypothetical protein
LLGSSSEQRLRYGKLGREMRAVKEAFLLCAHITPISGYLVLGFPHILRYAFELGLLFDGLLADVDAELLLEGLVVLGEGASELLLTAAEHMTVDVCVRSE